MVDDPQMEVEMDLAKENEWLPSSSSSSPSSTVDWLGGKKLFWPLFWTYTDADSNEDSNSRPGGEEAGEEEEEDYSIDYGSEEHVLSGVGGDWDAHWNEGWDPVQSYYGEVSGGAAQTGCGSVSTVAVGRQLRGGGGMKNQFSREKVKIKVGVR